MRDIMKKLICYACTLAMCFSLMSNTMVAKVKAKEKVSKIKVTLYADSTTQKTKKIKLKKSKKKVKWSSSNKKVVKVKKGKLTALKKGTATITATYGKNKLKCKVIVKNVKLSTSKLTP